MNTRRIGQSKPKTSVSGKPNGRAVAEPDPDLIPDIPRNGNGLHVDVKPDAGPVKDEEGQEITQPKLIELWSRRSIFSEMMTSVSKIKSAVNRGCEAKDPLFTHVNPTQVAADCGNVYRALRFARPYAICPYCGGRGCKVCGKSGFVGEVQFKNYTPEDLKV